MLTNVLPEMAFGCVRAIINRKSAIIFDAHKPTIKVSVGSFVDITFLFVLFDYDKC